MQEPIRVGGRFAGNSWDLNGHGTIITACLSTSRRVAISEDAGHLPHMDQPDAVATAINRFLRQPASQLSIRNCSRWVSRAGLSSIPAPRPEEACRPPGCRTK